MAPSKGIKPGLNKRSTSGPTKERRNTRLKEQQMREEEARRALHEKKRVYFDRNQVNIHSVMYDDNAEEFKDMKEVVETDVKSPNLKRRATIQNFAQMFEVGNRKLEHDDFEQRQLTLQQVEEKKKKNLEWRAQYHELEETVEKQKARKREKSESRKIQGDLIRVVHTEENESQIQPRLKESFWEKIGFKNKAKEDQNLTEARDKIDKVYKKLRDTARFNYQIKKDLDDRRQQVKAQAKLKKQLQDELTKQEQLLVNANDAIELALKDQDQQNLSNKMLVSLKEKILKESQTSQISTHNRLQQQHESAQASLEDQEGKYWRIKHSFDRERERNINYLHSKDESMLLQEEENQIDQQLAMSKPLVTEIMEYFNAKESESQEDEKIEEWVEALQMAIEECLNAEQKFQKAAYYDAQKFLPFERTQRSAYTEKHRFNQ
ncbi:UNKNOWN [Stylonychia lemnae]|uniref:Uncharacterized protein n=1 Tax=Stylonychia lemnae TaxID=5949 RepID=A0A078ANP5_STYLE|nr:UNKNOWN [Stylonychia lemnae]|eukprot:CDW83556.1 UNKNOWN [Stylonychia lemnae]